MTELEDVKSMRRILENYVTEAGSYKAAADKLSNKKATFSWQFISMAAKGTRNISTKLAKALGYEKVVKYRKVK